MLLGLFEDIIFCEFLVDVHIEDFCGFSFLSSGDYIFWDSGLSNCYEVLGSEFFETLWHMLSSWWCAYDLLDFVSIWYIPSNWLYSWFMVADVQFADLCGLSSWCFSDDMHRYWYTFSDIEDVQKGSAKIVFERFGFLLEIVLLKDYLCNGFSYRICKRFTCWYLVY